MKFKRFKPMVVLAGLARRTRVLRSRLGQRSKWEHREPNVFLSNRIAYNHLLLSHLPPKESPIVLRFFVSRSKDDYNRVKGLTSAIARAGKTMTTRTNQKTKTTV